MPRFVRFRVVGRNFWGWETDEGLQPLDRSPYDGGIPVPLHEGLHKEVAKYEVPATPSKIIAVGRNYLAHAKELGNELPERPLIFFKPPSALIGHKDEILLPSHLSQDVHHEGELGVVIGRNTKNVSEDEARQHILGYTIVNDVTARDLQKEESQFTRAKGFDTFCPVGPYLDTDFLPADQKITVTVNGELKQEGRLSDMIFSVPKLVSYLSSIMTLLRGDLILTGTPEGVGPIQLGDKVVVSIEGLGSLENTVGLAEAPKTS